MNILIIEDQAEKAQDIQRFVNDNFDNVTCVLKTSLKSGLREVVSNSSYDLLLLDMSMPSFDLSIDDPLGGKPESFAGKKILENMYIRNISIPVVVVSQYSQFNDGAVTLEEIDQEFKCKYGNIFLGAVYYTSAASKWCLDLMDILKEGGVK